MPRKVVPVGLPSQPPPALHVPTEPVMPVWALALILSALAAVSSVVVCVGWLAVELALRQGSTHSPTPRVASISIPIDDNAAHGTQWLTGNEEPKALPSTPAQIAIPSDGDDAEPSAAEVKPLPFEHPRRMPTLPELPTKAPPAEVLQRVEVAKLVVPLEYSVRRLALPDAPTPLRLAIAPVAHDDVAKVMNELGAGYRFTHLAKPNLLKLETLKKYDVVFLSCADLYVEDLQAAGPLRKFVEAGGTLYASDLQLELVLRAFPEFRGRTLLPGIPQQVDARVVDAGLASHLGRSLIPLTFEAPDWRPAAFDSSKVTVCLQGAYRNNVGKSAVAPLLVKFRVKSGTVIFTSFHHSKNDSAMVRKLIDYLVFASLSARSEARVHDLMTRHGFEPKDTRPLVLDPDTPTTGTFEHRGGGMQIALGFEPVGARIKLTLRSPTDQTIEYQDEGVFLLELPNAEAGTWHYIVTPLKLPHARFPLIVGTGVLKR